MNTPMAQARTAILAAIEDATAYHVKLRASTFALLNVALVALDVELPAVPALAIDKALYLDGIIPLTDKVERRIVWGLIAHLARYGFALHSVNDGEEVTRIHEPKAAMELIFNVDEVSLRFSPSGKGPWHGVLLVLGNGEDIVSDWNYYADDRDGFNKAMEAFTAYPFPESFL